MDEEEQLAIRHVLMALLLDGESVSERRLEDRRPTLVPLNRWQLDSYFRQQRRGEFKPGEVVRVKPPLREAWMSAIWCRWNYEGQRGERTGCWFYLGIWLSDGGFIAFRFEPPQQGDNHNYYHSQPCRTMGWDGNPVYSAIAVPERNPTWPLAAKSSLDLLLCLVVAIGGMRGLLRVQSRINSNGAMRKNTLLTQALRGMMALRHG